MSKATSPVSSAVSAATDVRARGSGELSKRS